MAVSVPIHPLGSFPGSGILKEDKEAVGLLFNCPWKQEIVRDGNSQDISNGGNLPYWQTLNSSQTCRNGGSLEQDQALREKENEDQSQGHFEQVAGLGPSLC